MKGKVAIVTGAAKGNGEGAARVMAREGALAVLTDALELVHKTAKSINDNAHKAVSFKMDVTEPTEVNYLAEKVLEQFCKVDRLVNNAGVLKLAPLVGMVVEVRDKMIKVNIKRIPTGRLGTMEELGELVTFLASDEARYTTGTPVLIDGRNTLPESGVFTLA